MHQCRTETARETEDETEEPKNIHVDGITWRPECVESRRGEVIPIGDPSEFLGDLLKKPRGHLGGIRLEVLVAFDEKCSNCRGEYTRLKNVEQKVNGFPNIDEPL